MEEMVRLLLDCHGAEVATVHRSPGPGEPVDQEVPLASLVAEALYRGGFRRDGGSTRGANVV